MMPDASPAVSLSATHQNFAASALAHMSMFPKTASRAGTTYSVPRQSAYSRFRLSPAASGLPL